MEHKNASGVKRVGAGSTELVEQAKRHMSDTARFPLRAASRFRDTRCYLEGLTLRVKCAALTGTVRLPARLDLAAPALGRLGTKESIRDSVATVHMTHDMFRDVVEPFLTAADLRALHMALQSPSRIVSLSVDGTVLHECVALNKPCYCADRRCPVHWTYTLATGNRCPCKCAPWEARDALATFDVATGELFIDSPSMHEFYLSVKLPLRMRPRGDGVLELKSITYLEYTCQ